MIQEDWIYWEYIFWHKKFFAQTNWSKSQNKQKGVFLSIKIFLIYFFYVGPPKEDIFLTTFYSLYFSSDAIAYI